MDAEHESSVVSFKSSCSLHPIPVPPKVLGSRVSRQRMASTFSPCSSCCDIFRSQVTSDPGVPPPLYAQRGQDCVSIGWRSRKTDKCQWGWGNMETGSIYRPWCLELRPLPSPLSLGPLCSSWCYCHQHHDNTKPVEISKPDALEPSFFKCYLDCLHISFSYDIHSTNINYIKG